jgi:MerR family transcriptional regulator, light-induced transcriptional regulator
MVDFTAPRLLSPRQLAQVIGASESSLKRWIDSGRLEAVKTEGGHRRVPVPLALRFIRDHGHRIVDPSPLGLHAVDDGATDKPLDERLITALTSGNADVVRTLLISAYAGGMSVAEMGDGPVRTAMAHLGELWKLDEGGIALEHVATDICLQALHVLRSLLPAPLPTAPVALGCAPARDPYLLPSILAAMTLGEIGYRTVNLGPDTPLESLRHAVEQHRPRLVWISVSTIESQAHLRAPLAKLADELAERNASLVVGGRTSGDVPLEHRPNMLRCRNLMEIAAFSRGLIYRP